MNFIKRNYDASREENFLCTRLLKSDEVFLSEPLPQPYKNRSYTGEMCAWRKRTSRKWYLYTLHLRLDIGDEMMVDLYEGLAIHRGISTLSDRSPSILFSCTCIVDTYVGYLRGRYDCVVLPVRKESDLVWLVSHVYSHLYLSFVRTTYVQKY